MSRYNDPGVKQGRSTLGTRRAGFEGAGCATAPSHRETVQGRDVRSGNRHTCAGKLVGRPAARYQPLAPIDRVPLVDRLRRVQQVVEQLVQVLGVGRPRADRVYVRGRGALALRHEHLGLEGRRARIHSAFAPVSDATYVRT